MEVYEDIYPIAKSIAKYFVNKLETKIKIGNILKCVQEIISGVLIAIVFIFMTPFILLRTVLEYFLKYFYGKKYVEMLAGFDKSFIDDPVPIFINTYILEHNGNIKDLLDDVKTACKVLYSSNLKFSSVVKKTLGYHYFISDEIKFDEIVTTKDFKKEFITTEDLSIFFDEHFANEKASNVKIKLWEVTVIENPIVYNKLSENKNLYAILFKTTHTLADAIYLSAVHQNYLFDKCDNTRFVKALKCSKNPNANCAKNIVKYLTSAVKPCRSTGNNTHITSMVYLEENAKYLDMVKEIKDFYKVTFSQVMYTAAVYSVYKYLKQKDTNTEKILFGYPLRSVDEDVEKVMKGKTLQNEMSFLTTIFKFPKNGQNIKDKLFDIARCLNEQKNSTDNQVMHYMQKLSSYLPYPVMKAFMKILLQPVTVGFSNIPSVDCASINGHDIKDGFVYVNVYQNTKFLYQMHTFNGRLQLNLTVAKQLIDDRRQVEDILRGVLESIEELHRGLNNVNSI